jgi:TRAP-type C4-dicarboxylate transport system substrate-binding protein
MIARRTLLAAGTAALAAPAIAQTQPLQLRISTVAPEAEPTTAALRDFATRVEAALPGRVQARVFPGGSLFRQGTEITAMQRGQLESATPLFFEFDQQLPEWSALGAPYAFRDAPHLMATMRGDIGREFYAAAQSSMQLVALDVGYIGTRHVNLRTPVTGTTPAALQGLKLRVQPGGRAAVAIGRGLGLTPVPMPVTEVYVALRSGVIDATESPLPVTEATRVSELIQQVVLTGHLVQPFILAVGEPFMARLTAPEQQAVRDAARAAMDGLLAVTLAGERDLVPAFERRGIRFLTPDREAFRSSVMRQMEQEGLTARWRAGLLDRITGVRPQA